MSESHISIDHAKYNDLTNEISSAGQECLLNASILEFLGETSKTSAGTKLGTYLEDLCKSSNMHNKHVSDSLIAFLVNLREEYEKLDNASSETLKLE